FEPAHAVAWKLNPSLSFDSVSQVAGFYATLTSRLRDVPGVESVGLIDALPLGKNRTWGYRIPGVSGSDGGWQFFFPHMIDSGYLEAMRIPLVAGRNFTERDTDRTTPVVLVNETAARLMF